MQQGDKAGPTFPNDTRMTPSNLIFNCFFQPGGSESGQQPSYPLLHGGTLAILLCLDHAVTTAPNQQCNKAAKTTTQRPGLAVGLSMLLP